MELLSNDENSVRIRKYSNRLTMAGRAVIIFGLWSSLRVVILALLGMDDTFSDSFNVARDLAANVENKAAVYAIATVVVVFALVIPFLINLFIGRRAIMEGTGKKSTTVYLVVAALLLALTIFSLIYGGSEDEFYEIWIASIIVDITLCGAYIDVIYSAIRLKKCSRIAQAKEVEPHAD